MFTKEHLGQKISLVILAGLGAAGLAGCGEAAQYETIEHCDTVDKMLATTGSKIDGARFLFGDGNIATVPDDKYFLHTDYHEVVELDAKEYMSYDEGDEYCTTERVVVPASTAK